VRNAPITSVTSIALIDRAESVVYTYGATGYKIKASTGIVSQQACVFLGDMTGADLDAQVRESNAHASGHLRNVRLLTALRKRVGPTDRVRDKWSEAEAVKLNDSVNKAA